MFARSAAAVAAAASAATLPSVASALRRAGPAAAAPGGRSLAAAAKADLMPPLTVAVTGAAGQIGYALLMRIARCVGGRPPVPAVLWAVEGRRGSVDPARVGHFFVCECVCLRGWDGGRQRMSVFVDMVRFFFQRSARGDGGFAACACMVAFS